MKIYDHETAGNLVYTSGPPVGGRILAQGDFFDSSQTYYLSYNLNSDETVRYEIVRSLDVSHVRESENTVKFTNVPSGATVYVLYQPYANAIHTLQTNNAETPQDLTLTITPGYTYYVGIKEKGKSMSKIEYMDHFH